MTTPVLGIDIGSESVRAVELVPDGHGRATLHRYHEVSLPAGAVVRGEVQEPLTVTTAIKQLRARGGFKTKKAIVGVSNQKVIARDFSVPHAPLRQIRETLPFHAQDLLPVPAAEALLDFYPVSESQGDEGRMINGLLLAAVKDAVLGNVKAVQSAGLDLQNVDLIPFALVRALLDRAALGGTTAIIDLGASSTTVVIARGGVPQFVRIIPSGSADLTQALAQRLEITTDAADAVKQKLGLARSVADADEHRAVQVIYDQSNEILGSLRNTVNYFTNVHPDMPVEGIIITGGAAALPGLMNALADVTRLPVGLGNPFANVTLGRGIDEQHVAGAHGVAAVAVGLALGSVA
ncbi:type IV pilus assembly protein PilM [Gryllotalpicola reticulitermitis]|uniref:Type IV pilus assembly protein PilM n=1 Tax=Gryllotalpicola reticulitermitis TaxID=1184153 RepID=A0ABV8Q3S9_9MICO